MNHTRIVGASHCPPLSEQPVTKKPNAFLGYIPESVLNNYPGHLVPSYIQQHLSNPEQSNPYNQPIYQPIPSQTHRPPYVHTNIGPSDQVNVVYGEDKSNRVVPDDPYYSQNNQYQYDNGNGNTKTNTISPLPYHGHSLKLLNERINIPLSNTLATEQPLRLRSAQLDSDDRVNGEQNLKQVDVSKEIVNVQASNINPMLEKQEKQLSQLTEEIEDLKTQLEVLTNENERLVENLNHILPHSDLDIETKITENSQPASLPEKSFKQNNEITNESEQVVSNLHKILVEPTEKQLNYEDLGES